MARRYVEHWGVDDVHVWMGVPHGFGDFWTRIHADREVVDDILIVTPFVEGCKIVRPHYQAELLVGIFFVEMCQC